MRLRMSIRCLLFSVATVTCPLLAQPSPYAEAVLIDHPNAYWRLTSPQGTQKVLDLSGNGWTATAKGETFFGSAPGAMLNESVTSLELAGSGWLSTHLPQNGVSQYSIEMWFNTVSSVGAMFQDRGPNISSSGVSVTMTVGFGGNPTNYKIGQIRCGADGLSHWTGGATTQSVFDGKWHHAVCVFSGANGQSVTPQQFTIYLDGVAQSLYYGSDTTFTAPLSGLGGSTIALHPIWYANSGLAEFIGLLEEVAVYDYGLSAGQVATHYHASGR